VPKTKLVLFVLVVSVKLDLLDLADPLDKLEFKDLEDPLDL